MTLERIRTAQVLAEYLGFRLEKRGELIALCYAGPGVHINELDGVPIGHHLATFASYDEAILWMVGWHCHWLAEHKDRSKQWPPEPWVSYMARHMS